VVVLAGIVALGIFRGTDIPQPENPLTLAEDQLPLAGE